MGGDGFEREEQRRPAKANKVSGDERAGIYARRVGVQSLLPGKRERRHVQPSFVGCFGNIFFRFRYVFVCFHRSVFLLDEYKDDDAIFGNDGKKCLLEFNDIRRYMITKEFWGMIHSEPKMREREERSSSHFFLLIRRFDSRARLVAI